MNLPVPRPEPVLVAGTLPLDRRSEHRLHVCVPVRITYVDGERRFIEGTCTNISTDGAAFHIDAVLHVGDVIDFEFRNTNDVPVTYRARVLFRNGNQYGTYFVMAY